MSSTIGICPMVSPAENPAPQIMDVEDESFLNHKNKKFCNDMDENSIVSATTMSDVNMIKDSSDSNHHSNSLNISTAAAATTTPTVAAAAVATTTTTPTVAAATITTTPTVAAAVDVNEKIDYGHASKFWKAVPATVNGMLGGFGHISSTDINGSSALIKWIYSQKDKPGHGRCVDCGAGIGRITQRLLQKHFGKVDLVEQSPEFVEKAKDIFANNSKIGEIYCVGLQDFMPSPGIYDVVWTQWVSGYLRDDDLIAFFCRMSKALKPNGVLVVKENFTTDCDGVPAETVLDSEDSSVTRPLTLLLKLASASGLNLIRMVQQRRFPKQLYKVYMLVFKPEHYSAESLSA